MLFRYFGIIDVTDFDLLNIYHFSSLLLVLFVFMLFLRYVYVHSAWCDLTIVGCLFFVNWHTLVMLLVLFVSRARSVWYGQLMAFGSWPLRIIPTWGFVLPDNLYTPDLDLRLYPLGVLFYWATCAFRLLALDYTHLGFCFTGQFVPFGSWP